MVNLEGSLAGTLTKKNLTISIAESCTGGLIAHRLTNTPGSSRYFKLGIVAYSNRVKNSILKVSKSLIVKKGTVSREVAILLAQGVRKLAKTHISLGITGIAGPTGATKNKPVGLVFIAATSKNKIACKKFNFKGNRCSIKNQACEAALRLLRQFIKQI